MLFIILSIFLPSVFSLENCSIGYNHTFSAKLPDQVICKQNETYTIIEVDPILTGARCLDGSNYKFMIHEGSGEGKNKFLFYFPGAGYCGYDGYETLDSCYHRSALDIGSSLSYGPNGSFVEKNNSIGFVSSNPEVNPVFWNWNIFYLLYCDGTNEQGYREEPLYYNDTPVWFRGYNNTKAAFDFARYNMSAFEASEIVISGSSSGGAAAMVWTSYLQDYFPKTIPIYGLSDGGLMMDIYSNASGCYLYRWYMQNLVSVANMNATDLYRRCPYGNDTETIWKCMMPEYIYKSLDVDFFIANSQYDMQQIVTQLGVVCLLKGGPLFCTPLELGMMVHYREQHLRLALKIKKLKPSWGFWLRTCFEHIYLKSWGWYGQTMNVFSAELGNSLSYRDALALWFQEKKTKGANHTASYIDLVDWKHNPLCVYDEIYRDNDNSTSSTTD